MTVVSSACNLYLYGQPFYMEVIPELFGNGGYEHMIEDSKALTRRTSVYAGLYEVGDIRTLDCLMGRFNSHYTING